MESPTQILAIALLFALNPAAALCQSRPALPRIDLAASVGFFTDDRNGPTNCCGWADSVFKGLSGGFYWTDHIKTEIELSAPAATRSVGPSHVRLADGSYVPSFEDHTRRDLIVSAGQLYQFGRNAMLHPFAGAGLDVDRERDEFSRSVPPGRGERDDVTTTRVRSFVTAGFKEYFSERAFFRGELKIGFDSRVQQIVGKAGVGVDF
jgi:hypothetical protein